MTNNKLIAEFMGLEIHESKHKYITTYYVTIDGVPTDLQDLQYHTSWDWLMPVVQKIESLGYVFTIQGGKAEYGEMISETQCFIAEGKLSSTYKAVVEFIKEYDNGRARI